MNESIKVCQLNFQLLQIISMLLSSLTFNLTTLTIWSYYIFWKIVSLDIELYFFISWFPSFINLPFCVDLASQTMYFLTFCLYVPPSQFSTTCPPNPLLPVAVITPWTVPVCPIVCIWVLFLAASPVWPLLNVQHVIVTKMLFKNKAVYHQHCALHARYMQWWWLETFFYTGLFKY